MKRLVLIAAAATCTAVAAFAATEALTPDAATVIEIEVAPQDLAQCREELRQVATMPAVADDGSPLLFRSADELPQVRCVAASV